MASEKILRIARSDSEGDYVLVNVSSNGASPVDLKLLATEGESPYILKFKQSHIQKFRAKSSQLDETQWEAILQSILLRRPLDGRDSEKHSLEKLEVSATIAGEKLTIIIRKNISGITQRLGEISLRKDDSQEIDSVSWAATAVMQSDTIEKDMSDLRVKYEEQSRTVEKLDQQLEDLIKAKKEHENALLEKFQHLLNAKKLKIRDQQRLLASAKVDPEKAAQVQNTRSASISSNPIRRVPKRKASHSPSAKSSEDEVFEKMPVDQEDEAHPTPRATPERSDQSETEDEDDEDDEDEDEDNNPDPISISQPDKKSTFQRRSEEPTAEPPAQIYSLPPRRDLPFPSSQSTKQTDPAQQSQGTGKNALREGAATREGGVDKSDDNDDDDDDETSDDEL